MSAGRYTRRLAGGSGDRDGKGTARRGETHAPGIDTPQPAHTRVHRCRERGWARVGAVNGEGKSAKWLGRKALIRQSFVITARLFLPRSCSFLPPFTSVRWGLMPRDEQRDTRTSRRGERREARRLTERRHRCVAPTWCARSFPESHLTEIIWSDGGGCAIDPQNFIGVKRIAPIVDALHLRDSVASWDAWWRYARWDWSRDLVFSRWIRRQWRNEINISQSVQHDERFINK